MNIQSVVSQMKDRNFVVNACGGLLAHPSKPNKKRFRYNETSDKAGQIPNEHEICAVAWLAQRVHQAKRRSGDEYYISNLLAIDDKFGLLSSMFCMQHWSRIKDVVLAFSNMPEPHGIGLGMNVESAEVRNAFDNIATWGVDSLAPKGHPSKTLLHRIWFGTDLDKVHKNGQQFDYEWIISCTPWGNLIVDAPFKITWVETKELGDELEKQLEPNFDGSSARILDRLFFEYKKEIVSTEPGKLESSGTRWDAGMSVTDDEIVGMEE